MNVSKLVTGWKWQSGINNGPLPSPTVLWIVSSVKETPDRKEKKKLSGAANLAANVSSKRFLFIY